MESIRYKRFKYFKRNIRAHRVVTHNSDFEALIPTEFHREVTHWQLNCSVLLENGIAGASASFVPKVQFHSRLKSANQGECESAFWLGTMRSRLFKGETVVDFGLKKLLCRSEVAQVQKLRSSLYCERLKTIELLAPGGSHPGPEKWNISRGQADFLGVAHEGAFKNHYVVIEVEGLATQEQNREKSAQWSNLSDDQMFRSAGGYWGTFLRISEAQPERTSSEAEFTFGELRALQAFLAPMCISWYPALQSLRLLEGEGFWSPDWRCGDAPIEPGTSRS